jgi:PPOX class probable F420-dependent enzyme
MSQGMTPEEIAAFLAEPRIAHFATIGSSGEPHVRPVWYLWRDGVLWMTTRRKVRDTGRDLDAHPRVAVSIASEDRPYRAVVVHGRPEVLPKDERLLLDISTRYGEELGRGWVGIAMRQSDRVVLKLEPDMLISWDYGADGS